MKITSLLYAITGWVKKIFGISQIHRNPFTMSEHEQRRMFKKSKGGGHGVGFMTQFALPKSSLAIVDDEPRLNWHMQNRASWRKPRVPKAQRA